MTVSKAAGGSLPTVAVCIGSNGPYAFAVDTGSSRSIIDSHLASSLGLKGAGPVAVGGSGCATSGTLVDVPKLRMSTVALASQSMISASLDDWSGMSIDGVLGSDVLGRFGAVKLDFTKGTLTLRGAEGPAPVSHQLVVGKTAVPPPSALYTGTVAATTPLTIVTAPGTISVYAKVTVAGHGPDSFVVDTGSPSSSMSTTAASAAGIPDRGTGSAPGGVGCSGTVTTLAPTPVDIGFSSRTIPAMRAIDVKGILRTGVVGNLGTDALAWHGVVVVDYLGATLTLGPA